MKSTLVVLMVLTGSLSFAAPGGSSVQKYKFVYTSGKQKFELNQAAPNKDVAFKLAAKECYQKLTGGKYPGEERGLDIIDICANPKM